MGQNLRVNGGTGAVTLDRTLAYASSDANAAVSSRIIGADYSNQNAGTVAATVATQEPPNNGTLNTVSRLGVNGIVSLDIDGRIGTA